MITIAARNVEEAWARFLVNMRNPIFVDNYTQTRTARNRATRELTEPVATRYACPEECWLLDPVRDANPFFHVYESLWILAGLNDIGRLTRYAKQIATYSDDGKTLNGAYGYRMRHYFGHDQLAQTIDLLRRDPETRRAVIALYSPDDALITTRDVPCNTTLYFKQADGLLNLTVCNRSNDAVWGAYGANAVHFSFILQYVAGCLGIGVGSYEQVSDSLHIYTNEESADVWNRCLAAPPYIRQDYAPAGITPIRLVENGEQFDREVVKALISDTGEVNLTASYSEPFFANVIVPMFLAYDMHQQRDTPRAINHLRRHPPFGWLVAARQWLERRVK